MKWLSLALFGVIAVAMLGDSVVLGQGNLSIGDFIDTAACYSAIEGSVANKDGDKKMDPESYVGFVNLYGPDDFLDPSLTFEELPLILVNNFYFLACLCGSVTMLVYVATGMEIMMVCAVMQSMAARNLH